MKQYPPGDGQYQRVIQEYNKRVSLPNWIKIDVSTGSLVCHLESPACFSSITYGRCSNLGASFLLEDDLVYVKC